MLKMLCCAKPAIVKGVIKTANPDLLKSIRECSYNVLKGNVPLSTAQKSRLCRHKQSLRALAKKGTSVKRQKQILQKGGFIGALLKPVLSGLGGLLGF